MQRANPSPNSTSQKTNGNNVEMKNPPGNSRMGHGQPMPVGQEVVARLVPYPQVEGLTRRETERNRYIGPPGTER